jgi:hypothetical protein
MDQRQSLSYIKRKKLPAWCFPGPGVVLDIYFICEWENSNILCKRDLAWYSTQFVGYICMLQFFDISFFFFSFLFWQYWGLDFLDLHLLGNPSNPFGYSYFGVRVLLFHVSSLTAILCSPWSSHCNVGWQACSYWLRQSLENCLPGLASNFNPLDLSFPSSCDYRHEPLALHCFFFFWYFWKHFFSLLSCNINHCGSNT